MSPIYSTGTAITIRLLTEFWWSSVFEAQYSILNDGNNNYEGKYDISFNFTRFLTIDCSGGRYKSEFGEIASPGYPNSFPPNLDCIWTIQASQGNQMVLVIEEMNITQSEHCNEEYLELRDENAKGRLLGWLQRKHLKILNITVNYFRIILWNNDTKFW